MRILDPEAIPQVAIAFMNSDHREQARLINAACEALATLRSGGSEAREVQVRLEALEAYTRSHFAHEEAAMCRAGFTPCQVHKAEHDHVLAEMADEARWYATHHDAERLWSYLSQAVPAWLIGHIESMDLVTARFLAAQDHRVHAAAGGARAAVGRAR